jgi:hypothetical protein
MKYTNCLVLEDIDFTRDGNLKQNAFNAICNSDVVLHGTRVIKNRYSQEVMPPASNIRSSTESPQPAQDEPEAPTPSVEGNTRTQRSPQAPEVRMEE